MVDFLRAKILDVPDFPKKGVLFRDITPILQSAVWFGQLIQRMSELTDFDETVVAGVDARGFILGAALAHHRRLGFVPIRKNNKLPRPVWSAMCVLEYGREILDVHKDAMREGDKALVVDDVLATGGTAEAAVKIARMCGAKVEKCVFAIEIEALGGRKKLEDQGVKVESVFKF